MQYSKGLGVLEECLRQFAAGRGLAESNLHLFEPVQLLL